MSAAAAAKAAASAAGPSKLPRSTTSIPPAGKRPAANSARARLSAGAPRLAKRSAAAGRSPQTRRRRRAAAARNLRPAGRAPAAPPWLPGNFLLRRTSSRLARPDRRRAKAAPRRAAGTRWRRRSGFCAAPPPSACRRQLGQFLLHRAGGERRGQAAVPLDPLGDRPGLAGEAVGQAFERPAAAGRIGHRAQVALLGEHVLRSERETPRRRLGPAERRVPRPGDQAIGAADGGGEGLRGRAQQVDPGVDSGWRPRSRSAPGAAGRRPPPRRRRSPPPLWTTAAAWRAAWRSRGKFRCPARGRR